MEWSTIDLLEGKIVKKIDTDNSTYIDFILEDGNTVQMYHYQDCCERVTIDDIVGDLDDLVGVPLVAEEASEKGESNDYDSETWTFYKFSTIKGYVDIKWYGCSNGYYSESVDFRTFKTPSS